MMKVSDPIMFGAAVEVFYKDVFAKHAALFKQLGVDPNNGFGDLYAKIAEPARRQEGRRSRPTSRPSTQARPELAMVNSDKGITNLHVPSDVIIDASMPAVIRDSGKMWNATASSRTPRR